MLLCIYQQYGEEQVHIWRRSYDIPPPEGESLEVRTVLAGTFMALVHCRMLTDPSGRPTQLTAKRTLPYFKEKILPLVLAGKNVLVSCGVPPQAH